MTSRKDENPMSRNVEMLKNSEKAATENIQFALLASSIDTNFSTLEKNIHTQICIHLVKAKHRLLLIFPNHISKNKCIGISNFKINSLSA